MPYGDEVSRNKARLDATFRVWLASGVTSVVDVGGPMWNFDVRARAARTPAAPRVLVAGPLISMVADPELDVGDPPILKVSSPDEARAEAQRQLERHPDLLKVWFIHDAKDDLAAQEQIVRAVAETAHAAGTRLAVHATELEVAKAALRAGADVLVHSVEDRAVDAEFLALAKRNGAFYTPTLYVDMGYRAALSNRWEPTAAERTLADPQILARMHDLATMPATAIPPRVRQRMDNPPSLEPDPVHMANVRRVWDAGIVVALGTDAGNIGTLHGPSIYREAELMGRAGLSPREVLLAATANGAALMGLSKELGDVAPGKVADLVVLERDPLESVEALSSARFVIRGGRLFDVRELAASLR